MSADAIAYQGVPGAFSEEAAIAFGSEAAPRIALARFEDVFDAVVEGQADRGVVPIENTLAGSVLPVFDLLGRKEVRIIGESVRRIEHVLVGAAVARLDAITKVHSHPIALAQCEAFFRAHPTIEPVAAYNTAGAIADVLARGRADEAAIGSRRAAERYGGQILAEGLEDDPENWTRFLLLGRRSEPPPVISGLRKTSLVFTLAHRPGSLRAALSVFADRGIDLTKVESRPLRGRPFEYAFHADVVASESAPLDDAISALSAAAYAVRVFGTYRPA
jgi:prephenate dehydratase